MALQSGLQSSKVLILVGAGLTGSVILRSGRLSDLIAQLQDLLKGVNEVEIAPNKYDHAIISAQIRQLAQEIKELTVSRPLTILNGNGDSNGSFVSYLLPAAALGAMGYCYMWWKGWSFSDVMLVTRRNMANAVSTVSKQLENVHETLAATKRHLSQRLESLDWKLEEQKETTQLILSDINDVKSSLSEIGFDVDSIQKIVSGLEGKLELLESKQDITNRGVWYLCQCTEQIKSGVDANVFQEVSMKLPNYSRLALEDNSRKGLQFIAEPTEPSTINSSIINTKIVDPENMAYEKAMTKNNVKIYRSFPLGTSLT